MAKKAKKAPVKKSKPKAHKTKPKASASSHKKLVHVARIPVVHKAGRPAKSGKAAKAAAKPLSPSPIVKTKVVLPKTPSLIITRSQGEPPTTKEKPLSNSEIQEYRETLQQKRDDLVQLVARKKEMEFQEVEPEIGDEADIATASVEKDIFYEMTDVEQQALDSVEAALRKIEKGVFGRCEVCGQQIPRQRLDVMPWARNCVFCQSKNETPAAAAVVPPAE